MTTHSTIADLAYRQGGVILRRQAQEAGLSREQLRLLVHRGRWLVLHTGVYLTTGLGPRSEPPLLARLWAAHLRCGPSSVIGFGGAARLLRLQGLPREMPQVDVLLPRGRHPRPDIRLRLRVASLGPGEVVRRRGLPTTSAVRTLADLLLRVPEGQGLCLLDSALHQRLVTAAEVEQAIRYRRGAGAARALLPLADGRAESPLESLARLDCIRGGVPPDDLQYPVVDRHGHRLTRTDLCWWRGLRRPLLGDTEPTGGRPATAGAAPLVDAELIRFSRADVEQTGRVAAKVRAALQRLRVD
ncbi:type IV toxin-antitoxin system AbiEi family antitoxin domain-containing protein [Streptacidiphilus sp. EB129]|uniref:type IV toxin-antitoxin system AbiEi family antitoxin domain-containing protein n=1 Tax=Streptacidiphilus sp. EB129 TaxID=3156262 RepID=UPI003513DAA9